MLFDCILVVVFWHRQVQSYNINCSREWWEDAKDGILPRYQGKLKSKLRTLQLHDGKIVTDSIFQIPVVGVQLPSGR